MGFFIYVGLFLICRAMIHLVVRVLCERFPVMQRVTKLLWNVGLVMHELAHYLCCKLTLIPTSIQDIHLDFKKSEGSVGAHYNAYNPRRVTFLKEVIASLAPVLMGTWIVLLLWGSIQGLTSPWTKGIIIFCMFGIVARMAPSNADYRCIGTIIQYRPWNTVKQVGLLFLSLCVYIAFADNFHQIIAYLPYIYEVVIILGIELVLELLILSMLFLARYVQNHRTVHVKLAFWRSSEAILPFVDPMEIVD